MAYSYSWLKFVVALRQMLPSPSEINRGLQSQSPASKKLPTVALSVSDCQCKTRPGGRYQVCHSIAVSVSLVLLFSPSFQLSKVSSVF